jgi:quinoprotein glucose dehydrogenase
VVTQGNKAGNLFVLHRQTGKSVFGVEERLVPASDAEGEQASPTQPFPLAPPPFAPQRLTADDAWGATAADRDACRARMEPLRSDGIFTPPSASGSIAFPGNLGGMNWSGGAFDPKHQIYVTAVNNLPMEVHLTPRDRYAAVETDAKQGRFRAEVSPQHGTPYGMSRGMIRAPSGVPCNPPPWRPYLEHLHLTLTLLARACGFVDAARIDTAASDCTPFGPKSSPALDFAAHDPHLRLRPDASRQHAPMPTPAPT